MLHHWSDDRRGVSLGIPAGTSVIVEGLDDGNFLLFLKPPDQPSARIELASILEATAAELRGEHQPAATPRQAFESALVKAAVEWAADHPTDAARVRAQDALLFLAKKHRLAWPVR